MSVTKNQFSVTLLSQRCWYFCRTICYAALFFLMSTTAFAIPCQPVPIQTETIELQTQKPLLVLFHNTTDHNLYITHADNASLLEANKFSLLLLTQNKLTLHCVESRPGHEQHIPCHSALVLCQTLAQIQNPGDTKWLTENSFTSPLPDSTESVLNSKTVS